jgi:hypothetical protein
MRSLIGLGAAAVAAISLSGCSGQTPPGEPGVCYRVVFHKGQPQFIKLADHVDKVEDCAARLEVIRLSFLRMGGTIHEVDGAYVDQFIFDDASGVELAKTLTGPRYILMARTAEGQLVRPGYTGATPVGPQD